MWNTGPPFWPQVFKLCVPFATFSRLSLVLILCAMPIIASTLTSSILLISANPSIPYVTSTAHPCFRYTIISVAIIILCCQHNNSITADLVLTSYLRPLPIPDYHPCLLQSSQWPSLSALWPHSSAVHTADFKPTFIEEKSVRRWQDKILEKLSIWIRYPIFSRLGGLETQVKQGSTF